MSTCHRERRRELREAAIKVLLADKKIGGEGGADNEYLYEFESRIEKAEEIVLGTCSEPLFIKILKNKSFWYVSLMILLVAGGSKFDTPLVNMKHV